MKRLRTRYDESRVTDEPLFRECRTAQEIFSIEGIDGEGIFRLPGNRFSKQYVLSDINFQGMTDREQIGIIHGFSRAMKSIPCRFSYTVANEHADGEKFREKTLYSLRGDAFDDLRNSYNDVIREKVRDAKQGLFQSIYLTLTVEAEDFSDASQTFRSIETGIRAAFLGIGTDGTAGSVMRPVGINERMQKIIDFMHTGLPTGQGFDYEKEQANGRDWLNEISPAAVKFLNDRFYLNGRVGRVFCIDRLPNMLSTDAMECFFGINCAGFITVNNELLDPEGFHQEVARKYMAVGMKIENEKQRNRNNRDFLADASRKLLDEKEKLDQLSREIEEADERYFNTTVLILVLCDSEEALERVTGKVRSTARMRSMSLSSCFGKQREAMNSALCFGIQEFKHVTNLSSGSLAAFMPFRTQELNDPDGIYYGINQISQNAVFGDKKRLKNHNALILGQSGSGKSVFAKNEIISVFVNHPEDQIIIIDPQSEYGPLTRTTDGAIISFDPAKEFFLNPLDVDFHGVDYGRLREMISEKTDFVLTLLSACLRRDLSPEEQGIVDRVLDRVYSENYSMRMRLNGTERAESEFEIPEYMHHGPHAPFMMEDLSPEEQVRAYSPTLQDVYQGLLEEGSAEAEHLAASMEIFVNGSLNLFNHRTNVDLANRFLVFDISSLQENIRTTAMLIMMETVRGKIRSNSGKGRWTHLYIDEFHELLSVPQVARFVLKLWKEIRKMSGILNGITQNMSDLLSNEESAGSLEAILSNTECFALLSQATNDRNQLMQFLPEISPAMFGFVDNAEPGTGILKMGAVTVPFDMRMKKDTPVYRIVNTDGGTYGV